jgi:2-oxoglutarate dehydrogenase E2 component (dihydrolipoamide succinyltransferase)
MQIRVPPLGESITEATISRWLKREGEAVNIGDTLVELETDKITVEVPAPKSGVLGRRVKLEGDVVKVDEVLGDLDEAGAAAPVVAETPAAAPTAAPAAPQSVVRAAPSAIRLAAETGVDLNTVAGTGRGGVVSKPDVIAAMSAPTPARPIPAVSTRTPAAMPVVTPAVTPVVVPAAAPAAPVAPPAAPAPVVPPPVAPPSPAAPPVAVAAAAAQGSLRESREKMTTRRKRIAENLLQAQHATAHLTTFNEIDMSAISALRDRMKEKVEKEHGMKLSFMPFFAKAACLALKAYPTVNAQVDGDEILYKHYVNLGIAVASEAGLVVPNIKDADRKSILDIQRDIAVIAKKARDGKLAMDDLTGGSFTITNGGVFGSLISTPIINFPQVAILGLHKTQDRPVAVNGAVEIRPMMYVALSYDHRIIDGQQAVLFLVKVKELLEDPATMLID